MYLPSQDFDYQMYPKNLLLSTSTSNGIIKVKSCTNGQEIQVNEHLSGKLVSAEICTNSETRQQYLVSVVIKSNGHGRGGEGLIGKLS